MSGDLEELRVFVTVVDVGSVKGAALALGVARSTVRRKLESLERRVEAPLVWTDSSGVHLTPAGRILRESASGMLEEYSAILQAVRAHADE